MDIKCPGLNLHYTLETSTTPTCSPLNPELIDVLSNMGWIITGKIGEGAIADVFTVKNKDIEAVLILFSNIEEGEESITDLDHKLIAAKKYPNIFTIIYDYFKLDVPYTLDNKYHPRDEYYPYGNRIIQIIEKMDMNLNQYLRLVEKEHPHMLNSTKSTIRNILTEYIITLNRDGIVYTDPHEFNVGIIQKHGQVIVKLIDLESIDFGGPQDINETVAMFLGDPAK